ncbi:MAG: hypothetical protein JNM50_03850 [Chromatiales bacterium]|nr:hypothetical protein [Chromatiales bacterium]
MPKLPLPLRRPAPPTEERLLRLFSNRAELKREFARLQRDHDRLLEQLRQQEGEALRMQQRLDQVEGLLADPLRAANVAVYFQLRGIWARCRRRLARQAQDLAGRRRELERERDAARFRDNQAAALAAIDQRLGATAERQAALRAELDRLDDRRARLGAPWRYFERRTLEAEAAALRAAVESLDAQIERYARAREEKATETCVPVDVLGVGSRRDINLSVIALAQELLLHFAGCDLAALVREAALGGVGDLSYGGIGECRTLAARSEQALAALERIDDWPARVRRRVAFLRREVLYHLDTDTVPGPGALDSIPAVIRPEPEALPEGDRAVPVNVLTDGYWDLGEVLLA